MYRGSFLTYQNSKINTKLFQVLMNESPDDAVSMKGQKLMRVFKIRKIVENQNGRRLTLRGSPRVFSKI